MTRRNEKLSFKSPKWTLRGPGLACVPDSPYFLRRSSGSTQKMGIPSHKLLLPVPAVNREYVAGLTPTVTGLHYVRLASFLGTFGYVLLEGRTTQKIL